MLIVGGVGTLWGGLIGAAIIVFLKHLLSLTTMHWLLIIGSIYVIAMIYMPSGIMGILRRR